MPREESRYPVDWLRVAEKDLARVPRMLNLEDAEAAGFFLQQAVEKFLKAFLLSKGWQLERIHDLEALLNAALGFAPSFEMFRSICQKVTGFYVVERYPFVAESGLTLGDVRGALEEISPLVGAIRTVLT